MDPSTTTRELEDFLAETFFLYQSPVATCGCAVPRRTWMASSSSSSSSSRTCPLCGGSNDTKIVAVLDGYTHSLQGEAMTTKEEGTAAQRPALSFKYGPLSYHVGLPDKRPSSVQSTSRSSSSWFSLFVSNTSAASNAPYCAQEHVAHVLGLECAEMKVRDSCSVTVFALKTTPTIQQNSLLHVLIATK